MERDTLHCCATRNGPHVAVRIAEIEVQRHQRPALARTLRDEVPVAGSRGTFVGHRGDVGALVLEYLSASRNEVFVELDSRHGRKGMRPMQRSRAISAPKKIQARFSSSSNPGVAVEHLLYACPACEQLQDQHTHMVCACAACRDRRIRRRASEDPPYSR